MIFTYGERNSALRNGLIVAAGMIAIPLSLQFHVSAPTAAPVKKVKAPPQVVSDPRVTRLHRFLARLDCPIAEMAEDFVRAADDNELDWRLLPSIAVMESGGGKAYKNNNIFGWRGGEQTFATVRSGLELVAYKLGRSPLYRKEDSFGKLLIYNEDEEYAGSVMDVMNRISPDPGSNPGQPSMNRLPGLQLMQSRHPNPVAEITEGL